MDKQNQEIFNIQWILADIHKMTKEDLIKHLSQACTLIDELKDERNKYKKHVLTIKSIVERVQ
jgi:hypothetical protein